MLAALASCWALLLGITFLLLGSGLQSSLLGIRATLEGFPTLVTGLIMSGYYAGFIAGSVVTPRLVARVGHVRVFADVKKKHASHALTADVTLEETARAAEFAVADGVIVTGVSTGRAADPAEVRAVVDAVRIPVWVGSGLTPENLGAYAAADGFIVGSSVKRDGLWWNSLDRSRVVAMARAFEAVASRS